MTYAEYTQRGGMLTQTAYNRIIVGVMAELNRYTFGRVATLSPLPETVKRLIVELCDMSSTYNTDTDADYAAARYHLICNYLSAETTAVGTPLMYRGVEAK
ncbi:MAG: hypothetical protein IJU41_03605 [Clostridia bacterium]|nr:hypothetical protein [Clostridia bacterium]